LKIIGLKKDILHYGKENGIIIVNNKHADYVIKQGKFTSERKAYYNERMKELKKHLK